MAVDRDVQLLALVRELEHQDVDAAGRIEAVAALLRRVDATRERSREVLDALAGLPADRELAESSQRDARIREDEARAELAEAERRLEEVGRARRSSDDARVEAERAVRRARTAAADAAEAVRRTNEHIEAIAREEAALNAEAEGLAVDAQLIAGEVAEVPRLSDSGRAAPGTSLAEIDEWGARAHAALFVVRGGLEGEREKVVLEANALAAVALGEQTGSASVALVRRRLEESLAQH